MPKITNKSKWRDVLLYNNSVTAWSWCENNGLVSNGVVEQPTMELVRDNWEIAEVVFTPKRTRRLLAQFRNDMAAQEITFE